jgi:uncharacterized protein YacL
MDDLENAAIANDASLLRYLEVNRVDVSEYKRLPEVEKAHVMRSANIVPSAGHDEDCIECILRVGASVVLILLMFAVAFVAQLREFLLGELGYSTNEDTSDFVSYILAITTFLITCVTLDLLAKLLCDSVSEASISKMANYVSFKAAVIATLVVASLMSTQLQSLALLLTALSLAVYLTISVLLFSQAVRVVLRPHLQS